MLLKLTTNIFIRTEQMMKEWDSIFLIESRLKTNSHYYVTLHNAFFESETGIKQSKTCKHKENSHQILLNLSDISTHIGKCLNTTKKTISYLIEDLKP